MIDSDTLTLGIAIGLITIPGNWLGRSLLKRLTDSDHRVAIDVLTAMMILNFVYLAVATAG